EAKKILLLGLGGEFHHFSKDSEYPSGYKVATSFNDAPCTFLTPEGLCTVHKVSYDYKPTYCKEFPYEDGKLAEDVDALCLLFQQKEPGNTGTANLASQRS
ncbi:MAG: hypothetical protein V1662_03585, partial [Candidatus Omnitrophota bacterium]